MAAPETVPRAPDEAVAARAAQASDSGPEGHLDTEAGVSAPIADAFTAPARAADDRARALEALIEISAQIHAEEFHDESVLALIVERARELIGADVAWLGLADEERGRSAVKVAAGAATEDLLTLEVELGTGVSGLAARKGTTIIVGGSSLYGKAIPAPVRKTFKAERLVSVMCAPLRHGREVGALIVGMRRPTEFTEAQAALLTAFSAQAAITIVNSRLYQAVANKNRDLERTLALHRALGETALTGAGVHAIAGQLAHLIGRDVAIVTAESPVRGWRYAAGEGAAEPRSLAVEELAAARECHRVPVVAGRESLASLYALGSDDVSDIEQNALLQGATIIALEMMKDRAALETEWRLRGELLEEILEARGSWSESLVLRCGRFGVDLDQERCIGVVEPADETCTGTLFDIVRTAAGSRFSGGATLVAKRSGRIIVALEAPADRASRAIQSMLERARQAGVVAHAGLSSARHDAAVALREAEAALQLARRGRGPGVLVSYEQLGRLRFLLAAPDTAEMTAMVRDLLGPLADYDRRRQAELLRTLRAYLDAGGHHRTTSQQCHIHASTLKYRLVRIGELLDRSLADPRTRFELSLGFAVHDLLVTLGLDPLESSETLAAPRLVG